MTRVLVCIAMFALSDTVSAQSRVATPTFSVEAGEYATVVFVEVRVSTPGATIRFTQNGLDPTPGDPAIASGSKIAVNTSLVLKARAYLHGSRPSKVKTATYKIVAAHTASPAGSGDAAAGGAQSIIAMPDGRVLSWMRDGEPLPVTGVPLVTAVAAGTRHAIAVTQAGEVFGWGANDAGQLGVSTRGLSTEALQVQGLTGIARVAAGRAHSLALAGDGRVWAWGSNTHGQLGAAVNGRRKPTPVAAVSDVVAIAAGDAHSLALTRAGVVYAWGANNHGQLGDGTRREHRQPLRLALTDIVQVAAGATHSLALARDGAVYSWGSGARGELGTGSVDTALLPVAIPNLKAVAVRAGRRFSSAVDQDGGLMMWGANDAGQLGDGSAIDRSTPVHGPPIDAISAVALGARHALAVTAAGDVWTWGGSAPPAETLSDVADWGPALVPEVVAPPVIAPAAGSYPAAQTVTIATSDEHVTVRYTLDGSDPTTDAPVYSSPFIVSSTATVTARAYSSTAGVEPSAVVSATFVIDLSPPTIVASVSSPSGSGWHTAPVTVTFQCADDSGTVSCPGPIFAAQDGAGQLISGTAVDPAGNRTTATLTLNIDQHPPTVSLADLPDNATTTADQFLASGRVEDEGSGVAGVTCNGNAVTVVQGAFECVVSLTPGANSVSLQAIDHVGHLRAAGFVVTKTGVTTTLTISPDARTIVVSEAGVMSLRDEFGAAIAGASWTSSDESIAVLSDDDPPSVIGVAPGTAVISAEKDGVTAQSAVMVDSAPVLAVGTVRWSVAPTPGFTMAPPLFTHVVDPSVPDMFVVETQTYGEAGLRAMTADGEELWRQHSPGIPLMGDSFGGVIAGVLYDPNGPEEFRAFVRLGNAGGVPPWRYDSPGSLVRPAQASDGTIYAMEYVPVPDPKAEWDKRLVVIDGRDGRVISRQPLAREVDIFTARLDGVVLSPTTTCASTRRENAARTIGPMVGSDGRGYVLVRRVFRERFDECKAPPMPRRIIDHGLDLVILSPDQPPVVQPVFAMMCQAERLIRSACDITPSIHQMLPDGVGGMLIKWDRFGSFTSGGATVQTSLTRRDEAGTLIERPIDRTTYLYLSGQAGTAYAYSSAGLSAIDAASWTPKWTTPVVGFGLLAAHPDGGAAVYHAGTGELRRLDSAGLLSPAEATFQLDYPITQQFDSWIGVKGNRLHAIEGSFPDATRFHPIVGNAQGQLAHRNPGLGLHLKSQDAVEHFYFQHLAIWIAPANQLWLSDWYNSRTALPVRQDEFGNLMFTLGAGLPNGEDSTVNCGVPGLASLTKGINRSGDLFKPARRKKHLPIAPWNEVASITSILAVFDRYSNEAGYACFPDSYIGFYNSNSFAHSLLEYAKVPHYAKPPKALTPGWNVLIPSIFFTTQ